MGSNTVTGILKEDRNSNADTDTQGRASYEFEEGIREMYLFATESQLLPVAVRI